MPTTRKPDATTSERKCPPCAMRTTPMSRAQPDRAGEHRAAPAAAPATRNPAETRKKPIAGSPAGNEQLRAHWSLGTNAGVKCCGAAERRDLRRPRAAPMILEDRVDDEPGPDRQRQERETRPRASRGRATAARSSANPASAMSAARNGIASRTQHGTAANRRGRNRGPARRTGRSPRGRCREQHQSRRRRRETPRGTARRGAGFMPRSASRRASRSRITAAARAVSSGGR